MTPPCLIKVKVNSCWSKEQLMGRFTGVSIACLQTLQLQTWDEGAFHFSFLDFSVYQQSTFGMDLLFFFMIITLQLEFFRSLYIPLIFTFSPPTCHWDAFPSSSSLLLATMGSAVALKLVATLVIYILWWSVCLSVTKNDHFLKRSVCLFVCL